MQDNPRIPSSPGRPSPRRGKKRRSDLLLFLFFLLLPTVCAGVLGFVFYRAGYIPGLFSSGLTATVVAQNNASCQALIEKAMETSNSYCSQIGSNKACYGNNTIKADLAPGTTETFSTRGDIVDVDKVRRISASPLNLDSNEWGIAVLKVIANLPRSLPGQTVTMIVFGNTTLDNNSSNLESFFFSSELGQIVCQKVPDDGIMISVPDGEGIRFNVNDTELTLTGDATIKAVKNGKMEVSLFEGSGRIVSDGQEQYFGAGQKVSVELGGENGTEAVSPPSAPESLSQEDLDTACALTGQFCSQDQITPVPAEQAQQLIQEELGITPTQTAAVSPTSTVTLNPTQTSTFTRTPLIIATNTIFVIPSWTPSRVPTRTRIPIINNPPRRTPTRTRTPGPSVTPGGPTPYQTPSPTKTATITPSPTATPDPWSDPVCSGSQVTVGSLTPSGNSLTLELKNIDSLGTISIDALIIEWDVVTSEQILDQYLGLNQIGNAQET
ncbi:MAG TPA: hypothetical protein VFI68_04880, partial [Anaerolineales bacterium]|nr:hypothetical protein [Anaerolineales bacterium]